jgi:hypothetical protein
MTDEQRNKGMSDVNNDNSYLDLVHVFPLDDISRLLMPNGYGYHQNNKGHYFGAVCTAVSSELNCSVWDLSVYQVPTNVINENAYNAVYAVFDKRNPLQHVFLGYYAVD